MNEQLPITEQAVVSAVHKRMFVVFDLDGTLALTEHRNHFLDREKKDWRGFYAACDKDEPCWQIVRILSALNATGAHVEIWTGRSSEVRIKTCRWLDENGIGYITLRMRDEGDHRPDIILKKEWLDACDVKPSLVFEDRASVVSMWRENGIRCCQVAPGDF
jgi:hypothetical protein